MNCPKHFCFHWIEKGDKRLPFQFNNIEEALNYINDAKPNLQNTVVAYLVTAIELTLHQTPIGMNQMNQLLKKRVCQKILLSKTSMITISINFYLQSYKI